MASISPVSARAMVAPMLLTFARDGGLHLDGEPASLETVVTRGATADALFVMASAPALRAQAGTIVELLIRTGLTGRLFAAPQGD
jgi:hypothetical protein